MQYKFTVLVILFFVKSSLQDIENNEVEVEDENPFKEAASAIFPGNGQADLTGLLNNFMQGGGAKQIGDMLLGAVTKNDITSQIMQGLSSILEQKEGDKKGGLDPALLANVISK